MSKETPQEVLEETKEILEECKKYDDFNMRVLEVLERIIDKSLSKEVNVAIAKAQLKDIGGDLRMIIEKIKVLGGKLSYIREMLNSEDREESEEALKTA